MSAQQFMQDSNMLMGKDMADEMSHYGSALAVIPRTRGDARI
jgi:hypothetical protein